ncbi:MAG: hypothetical protein AB7P16_28465 [Bradyrhizobium sp.]|uniref:hypothetical protein n=1 Tax=Bradyrhizobium sp. TaxID=376 RepID=UPI003D0A13A4
MLDDDSALSPTAPAAGAANPYLDVLAADARAERGRLDYALDAGLRTAPDTAASALRAADALNLHPDLAAAAPEDAGRKVRVQAIDSATRDAPVLRSALGDPHFAAAAQDDVEALAGIETFVRRAFVAPFRRGRALNVIGAMGYQDATRGLSVREQLDLIVQQRRQREEFDPEENLGAWALANNAEAVGQFFDPAVAAVKGGIATGMTAGGAAALAGPGAPITVPAATVGGFAAGASAELVRHTFEVETGHAWLEYKALRDLTGRRIDQDVARGAAFAVGAVNAALSAGALGALARTFGVDPATLAARFGRAAIREQLLTRPTLRGALATFGKRVAAGVGIETLEEVTQEITAIFGNAAARAADGGAFEPPGPEEVVDRLAYIAAKTATGAVGLSAVGGAPGLALDASRARKAEQNREFYEALGEKTAAAKTHTRLPKHLAALVDRVAQGQPVQDVYVSAPALAELFQDGSANYDQLRATLPSVGPQLDAALASGGFVRVPLGEFTAKLAGTDQYARLAADVKFRPDEFTAREARDWQANHAADYAREIAAAEAEAQAAQARATSSERVHSDLRADLVNAGLTFDVAGRYATLYQSVFTTLGERTGQDAHALYTRYRPRVVSDVQQQAARTPVTRLDLLLDRLRKGRTTRPRDLYGPSLLEFLAEQGGMQDLGGELSARDLHRTHRDKPFAKRIVRDDGADFEAAARAAIAAGYFDEAQEAGAVSLESLLLGGIDQELAGTPRYAARNRNETAIAQAAEIEGLAEYLKRVGIDLAATDNATIARHLADVALQEATPPEAREYLQTILDQSGTKRGSITLPAEFGSGEAVIKLFAKHDLSTFLHESGHLFLEVLRDLGERDDPPAGIAADLATVRSWLNASPGARFTTTQHEQFARGFEAYLFEGRAPSVELRGVFARFRAWLVSIYRNIARLDVELTDDVRAVFDRLVATDDAIAAAEAQQRVVPVFKSAEAMGVSPEEFARYQAVAQQAHDQAVAELDAKALAELRRQVTAEYREARAEVADAVAAEIDRDPIQQAIYFLRTGRPLVGEAPFGLAPMRLARDALVKQFGPDVLARLPPGTYAVDGGHAPGAVAEFFGLRSGDELVMAMLNAEPRDVAIARETDRRMRAQFGDMLRDGRIEAAALQAAHNDVRAEFLAAEYLALSGRRRDAVSPAAEARRIARGTIERLAVAAVTPGRYTVAAQRAGRAAERALIAGDLTEAARQKRNQLLNHALARAALEAKETIDRGVDRAARYTKPGTRKRIARDYLDQIDALLAQYDFRKNVTQRDIARRKSLAAWAAEQVEQGLEPAIDERLLADASRRSYKDLTVEEFRGVIDALRSIEHLGRLKERLLVAADGRAFDVVVDELVQTSRNGGGYKKPRTPFAPGAFDDYRTNAAAYFAEHIKPEFAFEQLDGHRAGGPWWRALFKPLADAEAAELTMMHDAARQLMGLFKRYGRIERALWFRERRYLAALGTSLNKAELLALALNWGNEVNRERITAGYGWSPVQVQDALNALDARDWQFVQGVWDLLDSYWPQIEALQQRLTGVAPPKVEAAPVVTRFGTFRGGYYPIKYDARQSEIAFRHEEARTVREAFGGNWAKAQTRKGHTKTRAENVQRPVLLSLSVMTGHIENVIHDLTHRETVTDIDRLLQDNRVQDAIKGSLGPEFYRTLRPWLMNIAADRREPVGSIERILSSVRHGTTAVAMGFKLSTMLLQPLGYSQSFELLGARYALQGLRGLYGNPWETPGKIDFILARSPFMANRMKTFDRDVRDSVKSIGARSLLREVDAAMFAGIGFFDMAVSLPTWWGAYAKGMHDFANDEAQALAFADRTVRMSQGSGAPKDLAAVQHGAELKRIFTMFYSYFSTLHNLSRRRLNLTEKTPAGIARLALSAFYLLFVPAVLGELMLGRGPDDDEGWLAWAMKKTATYPLLSMILVRDIASAVSSGYGYQLSPVADAFEFGVRASQKASEGEFDEAFAKSLVHLAGIKWALPTRQAWITGDYLAHYFGGDIDEFSLYEALVTGDRDRKR